VPLRPAAGAPALPAAPPRPALGARPPALLPLVALPPLLFVPALPPRPALLGPPLPLLGASSFELHESNPHTTHAAQGASLRLSH
jgi:hypothetical protein